MGSDNQAKNCIITTSFCTIIPHVQQRWLASSSIYFLLWEAVILHVLFQLHVAQLAQIFIDLCWCWWMHICCFCFCWLGSILALGTHGETARDTEWDGNTWWNSVRHKSETEPIFKDKARHRTRFSVLPQWNPLLDPRILSGQELTESGVKFADKTWNNWQKSKFTVECNNFHWIRVVCHKPLQCHGSIMQYHGTVMATNEHLKHSRQGGTLRRQSTQPRSFEKIWAVEQ